MSAPGRRLLVACSAALGAAPSAWAAAPAEIRVDQLGYTPSETKIAYLMTPAPEPGVEFDVIDAGGQTPLIGHAGASRGGWNGRYHSVEPLDLTALHTVGTFRLRVGGTTSPPFRIAPPASLLAPLVRDTVDFFQAQRDGGNVIAGPLHRKPAHLHDRTAAIYAWPRFESGGSDVIVGRTLHRIGGPVNLEGGWMDAGDFLKFTHTIAYADTLLLAAQRQLGAAAPAALTAEARFGLRYLRKTWNPRQKVLYLQVGFGSGNNAGTFFGDHDVWRLPQRDDTLSGKANRYLRNRTVFRANVPGAPLPPNLAGRVSAAFALAAQLDAHTHPSRARTELRTAAAVFAAARTAHVTPADVVTALPHSDYPESSWQDDMELGAAELTLGAQALHDHRAGSWLRASAHWANAYLAHEAGHDTLNLYDTSALAHYDLLRAMRAAGSPGGLDVSRASLLGDLRAQLERGVTRATSDPFGAGVVYDDFDAAPHLFGLVATAAMWHQLTGDASYEAFATAQRDWALGDNPWGVSLMIGVGSVYPDCPQHVVANLSGSLDGRAPLLLGAVVNGPNDASLFSGGLGSFFDTAHACPGHGGDAFAAFSGHGSRFVDDVRSWQTVEPAIDFTSTAALAFALTG